MRELGWPSKITNMVTHRIITSSLKIEKFQYFSHSLGAKCRFEANSYRKTVVVCARRVVKRPSKRIVLVFIAT